jgi:dihydropteroate synthase
MGVLNVTVDSFSDGGRYLDFAAAIARARELVANGADIIDIGGESTRPGAHRVSGATESERVVPVITELARDGIVCSVDTTRATVAAAALAAGAIIVNDVSGGAVFGSPDNEAVILATSGPSVEVARGSKSALAHAIWDQVRDRF